jgi:transcription-repair coupling factor (superfamily II helicase)
MRGPFSFPPVPIYPAPMLDLLVNDPLVRRLAEEMLRTRGAQPNRLTCRGATGSSTTYLAGALQRLTGRPVVLVLAHADDADAAYAELTGLGLSAHRFPALETLPGETAISLDALAERLGVMRVLTQWAGTADGARGADGGAGVLVAPIPALMQAVPTLASLCTVLRTLTRGEAVRAGPAGLARWLDSAGYARVETIEEPGQFAIRGGILDVFPPGDPASWSAASAGDASLGGVPVRLDFFGDEIEKIHEIDLESMGVDRAVASVQLVCAKPELVLSDANAQQLADLLPPTAIVVLAEVLELTEQARGYYERVSDARGIFGPPAVFSALGRRAQGVIEASNLTPASAGGGGGGGGAAGLIELPVTPPPPIDDDLLTALRDLLALPGHTRVTVACASAAEAQRLGELLAEVRAQPPQENAPAPSLGAGAQITPVVQYVHQGFAWTQHAGHHALQSTHLLLSYGELLHRYTAPRLRRTQGPRLRAGRAMDTFLELQIGDYVVHSDHGIARFTGIQWLKPREVKRNIDQRLAGQAHTAASDDEPAEHLVLEFDGAAKLYVPAVRVDQVSKYIGGFRGKPQLSTLGGERWKNAKARTGESVRDLAAEMLRVRAAREQLPGIRYPADTEWQKRFEDEFPYTETDDQLAALSEIKKDMSSPKPMDRLLCGDVGFGKTELAVRASFKAAEYGRQVAVLVPTTVLAEQHERTFRGRLKDYPFRVESLSRFKHAAEEKRILTELGAGRVDIVIGTHRLLSKDVRFADLGLVVIDEEQRFGVEHKERLLALRMTADILTLSATPIPRTLHMSMLGLRDISSLTTAPADRRAVVTEVVPRNPVRLAQIIARELAREGQVFYVHNRIHDIHSVADDVAKLAGGRARVVVGHGQMGDEELEKVILTFVRGEADILVSTTIIESGIDIPRANTIIIEDADRFGLAELHQLRGRVGRSKHRGYCYLLLPDGRPLRDVAKQRLKALEQFSMLGAGFKIAMRDLEIRGAGNLLGAEQSGHIAAVGYDMYCQLLDRAVKGLRNEQTTAPSETALEIGLTGAIPKLYIPSDLRRLEAYRRVALCANYAEIDRVRDDLRAAYGQLPPATERLLDLAQLRIGARDAGVRSISVREQDVLFRTTTPATLLDALRGAPGKVAALPPRAGDKTSEVYFRPDNPAALEAPTLLAILRKRLCAAAIAAPAGAQHTTSADRAPDAAPTLLPSVKKPMLAPPPPPAAAAGKGGKRLPSAPPPLSKSLKDIRKQLKRK